MTETTVRLLCENLATGMQWRAEWGFSALIRHNGAQVLFDTGFSDVWQHNADLAGIDLNRVDVIALSHFHRDHTRGLLHHRFVDRKRVVAHPRIMEAVLETEMTQVQLDYAAIHHVLNEEFAFEPATRPTEIAPGTWYLGEIPRITRFEKGTYLDDPMPDDTALALVTAKGVAVISGCSHAGICNICEQAKAVTGLPLYAVIGGFHMMKAEDPPIEDTIAYFRAEAPKVLFPMHCVEFPYMAAFHAALGTPHRGAGEVIEL